MPVWLEVLAALSTAIAIVALVALGIRKMSRERRRRLAKASSILREWADENGYTIRFQEREPFFCPFLASGVQIVYRIVVEDRTGRRRRGWALCGGYVLGTATRRVEVRWDEPDPVAVRSSPMEDPLWDEDVDG